MYISAYSTKNCTSGIRTSGDCTSGGPSVLCYSHYGNMPLNVAISIAQWGLR